MRESAPMPRRTISISTPSCSARLAISLMKEIFVASMQLAAYLVSSALRGSITMNLSRLRLNGAYSSRSSSSTAASVVPRMIRSGRMQSSTAEPSLRNSGLLTTRNPAAPSWPRISAMRCSMRAAVPTGEVDLLTRIFGAVARRAMHSTAVNRWLRSAPPSAPGGVPTAMKISSEKATASAGSVLNIRLPEARLRCSSSSRPGSKTGERPALSWVMRAASTSTQHTAWPTSARQAAWHNPT
ncbi:hypothetical protein D9M71_275480 [compost metagenome]